MSQSPTNRECRFRTRASLLKQAKIRRTRKRVKKSSRFTSPLVYSVVMSQGLNSSEAEDVRQETMVSLFRKLPGLV